VAEAMEKILSDIESPISTLPVLNTQADADVGGRDSETSPSVAAQVGAA
jgi:hypothetical protein